MEIQYQINGTEGNYRVSWRAVLVDNLDDIFPYGAPQVNLAKRFNRYSSNPGGCWYTLDNLEAHDGHAGRHPTLADADNYIQSVLSEIKAVVKEHDRLVKIVESVAPCDECCDDCEPEPWVSALSL